MPLVPRATDYGDRPNPNTRLERGVGGGLIFLLDPRVEAGVNASYGRAEERNVNGLVAGRTFDILTIGGFANARIAGDCPPDVLSEPAVAC